MTSPERYVKFALNKLKQRQPDPRLTANVGAVIARGGRILSIGQNKPKMNVYTMQNAHHEFCVSIHAEIDAILRIRRKVDLRGATIYVVRLKKNGETGVATPCKMCSRAIVDHGIKRIFYTVDGNNVEVTRSDVLLQGRCRSRGAVH